MNKLQFLQPLLYVTLVYFLCAENSRNQILTYAPEVNFFGLTHSNTTTASEYFPRVTKDSSVIWTLYEIRMNSSLNSSNETLAKASEFANFKFRDIEQLDVFINELKTSSISPGVFESFWRFLSLTNIIWIVSILGITITFLPFLTVVFAPIAHFFTDAMLHMLRLIAPYFEQLIFLFACFVLVQGFHKPMEYGFYISFTSLIIYHAICAYALKNFSERLHGNNPLYYVLVMLMIPSGLLAVHYGSQLLGFLTVGILYSLMGFVFLSFGLSYAIGFRNDNTLHNCLCASLLLVPLYFYLQHISPHNDYEWVTEPFYYGVYVFAVLVYFLALLITSSSLVRSSGYGASQIGMIVSLMIALYAGTLTGNDSLVNVALTFGAFYLVEKFGEISLANGCPIIFAFVFFVITYFTSLWLNTHPDFIASIFIH